MEDDDQNSTASILGAIKFDAEEEGIGGFVVNKNDQEPHHVTEPVVNQSSVLGSSVNITQELHQVPVPIGNQENPKLRDDVVVVAQDSSTPIVSGLPVAFSKNKDSSSASRIGESSEAKEDEVKELIVTQESTFGFVSGITEVLVESNKEHRPLKKGSIFWITETKAPLGRVEEITGPVTKPNYIVRLFPDSQVVAGIGTHVSLVEGFAQHIDQEKEEAEHRDTQSKTGKRRLRSEEESHDSRKKKQNTNIVLGSSSNRPGSPMAHVPAASQGFNAGSSINRGRGGTDGRARGRGRGQDQHSGRARGSGSSYNNQFGLQQGMHFRINQQNQMGNIPNLTHIPAPRVPDAYLSQYMEQLSSSHMPTTQPGGSSGSTIQQQVFGLPNVPPRPELNSNAFRYSNHQTQQQMHPQTQSNTGQSFYQGGAIQPWRSTVDQNRFNRQQRFGVPNTVPRSDAFPSQGLQYPNQQQMQQQMHPQTQSQGSNVGQYPYQGGRGQEQHPQPEFHQGGRGRGF